MLSTRLFIYAHQHSYGGMDDGQLTHMNSMSGMQLTDNIDFAIENLDMYTSSFN